LLVQSYYNRQIADIIISFVDDPKESKKKKMGSKQREIIASFFDERVGKINPFAIEKAFACPLSLEYFESAVITKCGHTFEAQYLYQSLEHRPKCSIDRNPIEPGSLRPNHLITEVTKKLASLLTQREKLIRVFLEFTNRGIETPNEILDPETRCLVTEAVSLPCGHYYNIQSIGGLYESGRLYCPYHPYGKGQFSMKDLRVCLEQSNTARKVLKSIKRFNEVFVTNYIRKYRDLDARFQLDSEIIKIMRLEYRCPISKKSFKEPVVSSCGHTFERTACKVDSICPYDQSKISDLIPNYLVKGHLGMMHQHDPALAFEVPFTRDVEKPPLSSHEEMAGIFFYASPTMTSENIQNILINMGLFVKSSNSDFSSTSNDAILQFRAYRIQGPYRSLFDGRTLKAHIDDYEVAPSKIGSTQVDIKLHFENTITLKQYLEKMDEKKPE
jgi:hypothetical protein